LFLKVPVGKIDDFPIFAEPAQGQLVSLWPVGMPVNGFVSDIDSSPIGQAIQLLQDLVPGEF
jgi:hypothetical protein